MTNPTTRRSPALSAHRDRLVLIGGTVVGSIVLLALARAVASDQPLLRGERGGWLTIHLLTVIPTLPLGAYILLRRKGDALHRMLGRTWAGLMMLAALSSFGIHALTGRLSWIHLLSALVVVAIPQGILQAMRHDMPGHRRTMTLIYVGLIGAAISTFIPGRLLNSWLFS